MLRLSTIVIAALVFCVASETSFAQPVVLRAVLTNGAEPHFMVDPPPQLTTSTGDPRPTSFGNATFILNEDRTAMTFTAEIFNIDVTGSQTPNDTNDNLGAAHIHGSATVTPTTNAGVVWGFFGTPFNDNNPDDAVVTPFTTGVGGTFSGKWDAPEGQNTTLTEQLDNILNGRTYINFHTAQFGGGEIRGTLVVIPEPATVLVAICAGLPAVFMLRRRAR